MTIDSIPRQIRLAEAPKVEYQPLNLKKFTPLKFTHKLSSQDKNICAAKNFTQYTKITGLISRLRHVLRIHHG